MLSQVLKSRMMLIMKVHPMALIHPEYIANEDIQMRVQQLIPKGVSGKELFVQTLMETNIFDQGLNEELFSTDTFWNQLLDTHLDVFICNVLGMDQCHRMQFHDFHHS
jgi:hypothetical protein